MINSEINYKDHIYLNHTQDVVLVDYGPMQLKIIASKNKQFAQSLSLKAGEVAINNLLDLIECHSIAKKRWNTVNNNMIKSPFILKKMWEDVSITGEKKITLMASVKGVIADITADWLTDQGAKRVIVDNGGDISLRCQHNEIFRVGISSGVNNPGIVGYLDIDGSQGIKGVANSGLGGKGLTSGIADAVVVFAKSAGIADACATVIGNYTNVKHPLVVHQLACLVDPNTDIPDVLVTSKVNKLPKDFIIKALNQGTLKAKELIDKGIIISVIIFCQGYKKTIPENFEFITENSEKAPRFRTTE